MRSDSSHSGFGQHDDSICLRESQSLRFLGVDNDLIGVLPTLALCGPPVTDCYLAPLPRCFKDRVEVDGDGGRYIARGWFQVDLRAFGSNRSVNTASRPGFSDTCASIKLISLSLTMKSSARVTSARLRLRMSNISLVIER